MLPVVLVDYHHQRNGAARTSRNAVSTTMLRTVCLTFVISMSLPWGTTPGGVVEAANIRFAMSHGAIGGKYGTSPAIPFGHDY